MLVWHRGKTQETTRTACVDISADPFTGALDGNVSREGGLAMRLTGSVR